jgi:signal transduction histidine kinase
LAISYGIIQSHSGEIEAESEIGKGSTLKVKLPVEKQAGEMGR